MNGRDALGLVFFTLSSVARGKKDDLEKGSGDSEKGSGDPDEDSTNNNHLLLTALASFAVFVLAIGASIYFSRKPVDRKRLQESVDDGDTPKSPKAPVSPKSTAGAVPFLSLPRGFP